MAQNIINEIVSEPKYKSICKKLARIPYLADELYQEFILQILENKDGRLIKAKENNYLTIFCVGIINNIWNSRNRVKCYTNGNTSPLFEFSRGVEVDESTFKEVNGNDYDSSIDERHDKVIKQIETDRNSEDKGLWFEANVFYHATNTHKNVYQLSKNSNIYYGTAFKAYKSYLKRLQSCQ